MSLCLNMIVKDESHIIENTLKNLVDKITFDYWVICDTGSSDSTPEIIKNFFSEIGISGELHNHTWKDFAYNRTLALEVAYNKTDYVLIFDADDEICGTLIIPDPLELDSYNLEFGGGFRYHRPALVNNRKRWKYVGVLHETLIGIDDMGPCGKLGGDYYCISGKCGKRSTDPDRYKKDAAILEEAYNTEADVEPWLKQRYAFYCAQSYKDARNWDKAIEWYLKRVSLGGWNQEIYVSLNYLGDIYLIKGLEDNAVDCWIKSLDCNASRYESLSKLAKYYINQEQSLLTELLYDKVDIASLYPNSKCLFIDEALHNYTLLCDMILFYADRGKYVKSVELLEEAFARKELIGREWLGATIHNSWFISCNHPVSTEFIERAIQFSDHCRRCGEVSPGHGEALTYFIERLTPNFEDHHSFHLETKGTLPILVTITSCKRLSLFIKTINSFRRACQDLWKVMEIVCIDDGASRENRETIQYLYPWIRFIMKSDMSKGYLSSMEIIRSELTRTNAQYWLPLGDDFTFIRSDNYITKSISLLEKYKKLGVRQVLFNRGYAESPCDLMWTCGKELESGLLLHIQGRLDHCWGCWPHFRFRPSIIDVEVIKQLGSFESLNTCFEKDYADRYAEAGYKSAYLDQISWVRTGGEVVVQEVLQEEVLSDLMSLPLKVVNLKRRPDRLTNMKYKLQGAGSYQIIEAIDGLKIQPCDPRLQKFVGNDFFNNAGTIGCALTHIHLWEQLIVDDATDYYIIMEDDVNFRKDWFAQLSRISSKLKDSELVMLGYHMFELERRKILDIYEGDADIDLHELDRNLYIGGTFLYSINKVGAKKALDIVNKKGVKYGIDRVIIKTQVEIECKELRPLLGFSEWNENGKEIDSDIQCRFEPLNIANIAN